MKNRLIVALDFENLEKAKEMVEELSDSVLIYKVGLESFLNTNGEIIDYLHSKNKKVFLDLKFHDITNTVVNACRYAIEKNVFMFNIHCSNGASTIKSVSEILKEKKSNALFIGVTVLTNLEKQDLNEIFEKEFELEKLVLNMAKFSKENGMHGIVCSSLEAKSIKEKISKDFITVCPGIRPAFSLNDDQTRVMTPFSAIKNGADYLVVGRPISLAKDRKQAVLSILSEMEEASKCF